MGLNCDANQSWKAISAMLFICVIALVAILGAMYSGTIPLENQKTRMKKPTMKIPDDTCPPGQQDVPPNDANPAIFDELTVMEMKAAHDHIKNNAVPNLKSNQEARMSDAFVHIIEAALPVKANALAYLDTGATRPPRLANVYVVRGDLSPPVVQVYQVNLLERTQRLLEKQPFYKCQITSIENNAMYEILVESLRDISHILLESFAAEFGKCTDGKCLTFTFMGPHGTESGQRKTWLWLMRMLEGEFLHTLGVQMLFYHEGTNTSNWYVGQLTYNGQRFDSIQDLKTKYDNGTIEKVVVPWPGEVSHSNTHHRPATFNMPHAHKKPPRMYEPEGHRYTLTGRHVEYMGWSLDFALRTFNGLQVYNVKYMGERIAYEVGVQEMSAFYSGHNPVRMHTNYWDGSYLVGVHHHELVRGVDCPEYASMVDSTHFWEGPRVHKNSVCVFELNTGMPLRRHFSFQYGGGWDVYSGMTDNVLVVRSVASVYNYDYVYDYVFHQGGAIEIKWTPTGFVQGAFYTDAEAPYSFQLWKHGSANLHNHLASFRIDLDILGNKNSFQTLDIELENITSPYYKDYRHIQKVIRRTRRDTERLAALRYNFDKPKYYLIQKEGVKNEHNETRGYRIAMKGLSKMMYPENWGVERAAAWARYQISVTKHKDSEARSSSPFMQSDPFKPHIDFQSFIDDDENIVNEDLVAWVTLGTMHAPRAEDVPLTHTTGITQSIFLLPFNYFNLDPSMSSRDAVRITPKTSESYNALDIEGIGLQPDKICKPRKFPLRYNGTRFIEK